MADETIKIDTVPLPERPVSIEIPAKLLLEFERDARIVIRHPWVIGIPAPEALLKRLMADPQAYRELAEKFEIMFIPR